MPHEPPPHVLAMLDADVIFYPDFFTLAESDAFLSALADNIAWKQESVWFPGGERRLPRLTAWYGDEGKSYTYSSLTLHPEPWTPTLLRMKDRIEQVAGGRFNSVLLNLYRDGRDSVSWHSDDEPELGKNPVIASVSLGATRRFQFKHRNRSELREAIDLTHGSLLLMRGATQHFWKHQLPKTTKPIGPRINLTFRVIR